MLELAAADPIIRAYIRDLAQLKKHDITHELGLKGPFQNLLDKAAKKRGWHLIPELSTYSGGKRVVPDGTVKDEVKVARGWWEAKDSGDRLAAEIDKKRRAGYPTTNTIFEDTTTAVLYQDRGEAGEFPLADVQLKKTTLDWKQRPSRFQYLVPAIEFSPVFALCSAQFIDGAQMEHTDLRRAMGWPSYHQPLLARFKCREHRRGVGRTAKRYCSPWTRVKSLGIKLSHAGCAAPNRQFPRD